MHFKCFQCNSDTEIVRECYHYSESGLDNVYLDNLELFRCVECGYKNPIIPRIIDLHKLIAYTIFLKYTYLNKYQIKFLRKQLGYSIMAWANKLDIEEIKLANMESGNEIITDELAAKIKNLYYDEFLKQGGINSGDLWTAYAGQNIFLTYLGDKNVI